ncbi:cobamide remodeling phosphodiesterase CbiR [Thermodesulfobacteriota bacterium]
MISITVSQIPFKTSAPSMVYGKDLLQNVKLLADVVDNIEIVLFHTPSLNNTPSNKDLRLLNKMGKQKNVTFTVHLPASLEIASDDRTTREDSIRLAIALCEKTAEINPIHYILHVPFSKPTLVPVPGLYFKAGNNQKWKEWTQRALEALERILDAAGGTDKLLVENLNYSPSFLEPLWEKGFCHLCLDLGHMMLGQENVIDLLEQYLTVTKEIHLHGIKGYKDHLSLSVLPENLVHKWINYLVKTSFNGIINLEVFNPRDLENSMNIVLETCRLGKRVLLRK